jgi:hypothetical protein
MRWLTHITVAISLTVGAVLIPAAAMACGPSGLSCDIAESGTQLDIGGTQTDPGREGWGPEVIGALPPGSAAPEAPPEMGWPRCAPDSLVCVPVYRDPAPPAAAEDEEDDAIPAVTLADLASFVPAAPALNSEPAAAGVVGMPTNFVASAEEQTLGGALFGRPVTVRFTPAAFVFTYGDGQTGRSATGGASWESLGQAQFTATPTSHAYAERGTYLVSVAVQYAPAVDFGTGWIPVAGVVTASTGGYEVDIYEVRTALVDRTCTENPAGPGC